MEKMKRETLVKVQCLHDIIEKHPLLSGMMTDSFHNYLDFVIKYAHELDRIDKSEYRKKPSQEEIEEFIN